LLTLNRLLLTPSRQIPVQSQKNNARAKAIWPGFCFKRYFADFEQVFAGWVGFLLFVQSIYKVSRE